MLRGLFLASVIAAVIGGWAVITVEQLPDYVTAGRPVTLSSPSGNTASRGSAA